jgi:hypothetical protein
LRVQDERGGRSPGDAVTSARITAEPGITGANKGLGL